MIIPVDVAITFFLTTVILALVPGPDNIFVLTKSMMYGKVSGLAVVFGLCTGLIFHSAAVSLGVAVIFQKSAIAFNILKGIGAVYLLYLAYMSWKSPAAEFSGGDMVKNYRKLYLRGVIMNITNPKVSIFFLAFLPQFADPVRGNVSLQIIVLGGLFMVSTVLVFGAVALLAGSIGKVLKKSENFQLYFNKFASLIFVGLAVKLALVDSK
ncbi:MAG: LysE family translocator [Desulfotalea sp.]